MAGVLRPGTRGPRVRELQERLARLGFYVGPASGYYGPLTRDAVRRMQKAFRLQHDGLAGPQVWSVLTDPLLPQALPQAAHPSEAGPMGQTGPLGQTGQVGHTGPTAGPTGSPTPLPRLVLGLLEADGERTPNATAALAGRLSGWVTPWAELSAGADGSGELTLLGLPEPAGAGLRVRAVQVGPVGGRRWWRRMPEQLLQELRRSSPPSLHEPLLLAAAGTMPPQPGAAPLAPGAEGTLLRLAHLLARQGLRVWLALAVPTGVRPLAAYWRGYHLGRLCAPLERLILWAPPPAPDGREGLAALKGWLRGIRAAYPPWRTLIALDLWAWLYEPDARGRLTPTRRLSHAQCVLWNWRRRLGRAEAAVAGADGLSAEPVLAQREPRALRQMLLQLRWGGLGGVVVAGLAGSDPVCRDLLLAVLPPLLLSTPCISMERSSGEGGAPGVRQDPGRAGGAHLPPGRAYR